MDSSWVCYENYHTLNYLKKKYLEIFIHNKSTKNKNNDQIKVKDSEDIDKYREFDNADIILFDTPGMEKSLEFPKSLITKLPIGEKYALAGSISEDNVENISKLGVNFFDLSSSLEVQLGYKDHHKIKNFISKINEIEN